MKLFALRDESHENQRDLAYLECYERPQSFYIEVAPHEDPWELPFVLHEFVQKGKSTVDSVWSMRWAESRIVPPERQNLREVLRVNGLKEYDVLSLLELTQGRCVQDSCYLVPVLEQDLPSWYQERILRRSKDVYAMRGMRLMVSLRNGDVLLCDLSDVMKARREFARIAADEELFMKASMQPGGHGVRWGESIQLSIEDICERGLRLPISGDDVAQVVAQAVCDTSEAAELLDCTRQNVSDLMRRKKLMPLKKGKHGTLFLRSDVLARR